MHGSSRVRGSVALSGAACPGRSGTPALTLPRISSMTTARAFRGFRFPAEVILWAVRWYLQFPISYRDLEAMLADRGVEVDHTTLYRWIQRFTPELEKRMRRHLRLCRGPWHVDETYIRVNGQWRYLWSTLSPPVRRSPMIQSAIAAKLKRRSKDDFKGRHFEASLILQAVSCT